MYTYTISNTEQNANLLFKTKGQHYNEILLETIFPREVILACLPRESTAGKCDIDL